MIEYVVPRVGYNLIYHEYDCDIGLTKELVRYELTDNNKLWIINATYAKNLPTNNYYIVAPNSKMAKHKFKYFYSHLNVIASVELVKDDLVEYVLSKPKMFCLC